MYTCALIHLVPLACSVPPLGFLDTLQTEDPSSMQLQGIASCLQHTKQKQSTCGYQSLCLPGSESGFMAEHPQAPGHEQLQEDGSLTRRWPAQSLLVPAPLVVSSALLGALSALAKCAVRAACCGCASSL
eukprot:3155619-Amphidinium_carterae.1